MEDYKACNINSYNSNTKIFTDKFSRLMELHRRKEFGEFIRLLGDGKRILDLGCGGGDHSLYFKKQGLTVHSIDISSEMINVCKSRGLSNAVVMDMEELDFPDGYFDGVWAVTSLLHVPKDKIRKVIKKIFDILNEDGVFYVCLKEGAGEVFVQDKFNQETKRFFALWEKNEFLKETGKYFNLINFDKTDLESRRFIQFFLKKKA